MPYLMILGCVGFLFGTGGSALIGKTMGEGDRKHADRLFSMVICVTALSGLALGVLGIVLLRPVAELSARRASCWRTVCATAGSS